MASQCCPVKNSSTLASFKLQTEKVIDNFFSVYAIAQIIKKLNPNKSYGLENIFFRMIKICNKSVSYPLKLILQALLVKNIFPEPWKKTNIVLVHKNGTKNLLKHY